MRNLKNPKFITTLLRKPGVKEIYDNLENYTLEDIENINQPKWIRDALYSIKDPNSDYNTHQKNINLYIDEKNIISGFTRDPEVAVYMWDSLQWRPTVKSGFSVDVECGDLLAVYNNVVQLSSTRMKLTTQSMHEFVNGSKFVNNMKYTEFQSLVQSKLNDKYKNSPTEHNGSGGFLQSYGVKIGR